MGFYYFIYITYKSHYVDKLTTCPSTAYKKEATYFSVGTTVTFCTNRNIIHLYLPTTISVKSKPFLTAFLKTWFGKLAKPTYPSNSFVRLSGTALSLSAFVNRSLASAGVSVEGTVRT